MNRRIFSFSALAMVVMVAWLSIPAVFAAAPGHSGENTSWRIRFLDAAVVQGPQVTLGEVAIPVGDMPEELWQEYSQRKLWVSPSAEKGAVNMTRPRLQEAVMATMRDLAPYCLFPGSLALQRGGAVLNKDQIQQVVAKEITTMMAALPGENTLTDFRLPGSIFLKHAGQTLGVEQPRKLQPGRISLRLLVFELDGKVVQKLTGSVFIDSWRDVPTAASSLNKEDVLEPDKVTFSRANLAHAKGEPWDGRGGPWRVIRPLGVGDVIYQNDLAGIPTVRKGALVTIVYSGRNVMLSAQGEAMSDGVIGENIAVRNSNSKKEIYGVIRDANTVVVQPAVR